MGSGSLREPPICLTEPDWSGVEGTEVFFSFSLFFFFLRVCVLVGTHARTHTQLLGRAKLPMMIDKWGRCDMSPGELALPGQTPVRSHQELPCSEMLEC